jgi:hypothetical protein
MVFPVVLFSGTRKYCLIPFIDDTGNHGIEIVKLQVWIRMVAVYMVLKIMVSLGLADTMNDRPNLRREPCFPISSCAT